MMSDEHQRGGGGQGTPPLLEPAPESAKPPRKRPCRQQSPSPLPPPQLLEPQQEPSGQILAQNYIPSLTGVRQGDLREGVGLLPSLQADFMRVYEVRRRSGCHLVWDREKSAVVSHARVFRLLLKKPLFQLPQKPAKGRRAPREDLTTYTAEEKVERRKARARIYSDIARKRQEEINDKLKRDIVYMRCFRELVEQAPCLMAVLAPDLEAKVLYANGAFGRLLRLPAARVVGGSLWEWIHEEDRARLQATFTTAILTKAAAMRPVRCRMHLRQGAPAAAGAAVVEVVFKRGMQGVVCTLWVE